MKQICTETVYSNALVNKTVRLSLISRKTNAYAGVACNYMNGSDLELVRVKQVIIVTHIEGISKNVDYRLLNGLG